MKCIEYFTFQENHIYVTLAGRDPAGGGGHVSDLLSGDGCSALTFYFFLGGGGAQVILCLASFIPRSH
jgi:hypothetical protein